MIHRHSFSFLPALCLLAVMLAGSTSADIPKVISYQGRVTDAAGVPVADGTYTMQFRLYDAETGGSQVWESGDVSVATNGGVFSVLLGSSPQPAILLYFDEDYWLAVRFAGVDQTPRQCMASVGYAYMASGLVPGTEVEATLYGPLFTADNTATTGASADGLWGETHSTGGCGVFGNAAATTGGTVGVLGYSHSPSGVGVHGYVSASTGSTKGVYGEVMSTAGSAVFGMAWATTGVCYGGYFETAATSGTGVRGVATATTGVTYGVYGRSYSTTDDSRGVYGRSYATEGGTYGMYGQSDSPQGTGVRGMSPFNGVYGEATAGSNVTNGVYALAHSATGRALYAENTANGWAGYFVGDVNINGSLTVSESFFPEPAYDSGWVTIAAGATTTLTHSVGGNEDDYLVDIQHRYSDIGRSNQYQGYEIQDDASEWGFYWYNLTSTSITVKKASSMYANDRFRIRIWRY